MSMPMPSPSGATPEKKGRLGFLPAKARPAVITVGSFGVLLLVIQIVNSIAGYRMNSWGGIESRSVDGLLGIVTAPLLHGSWGHLLSNIVPLLVFGFLIMLGSVRQFISVTLVVWLVSGIGVWLFGPTHGVTVGASALVFGWLAYLVSRGIFTRSFGQILLGLLLLAIWGGIFWSGIVKVALGASHGISWQGHLFGAVGGVLAAFLVARADSGRKAKEVAAGGAGSGSLPPSFGTSEPGRF